jgi:hypothetical protein
MFKKFLVDRSEIIGLYELMKIYLYFSLALNMSVLERNFKVTYNALKNI